MSSPGSPHQRIDYAVVRRYFQAAGSNTAATASYMAHEQNLPQNSVRYRLRKEIETIADWLEAVILHEGRFVLFVFREGQMASYWIAGAANSGT